MKKLLLTTVFLTSLSFADASFAEPGSDIYIVSCKTQYLTAKENIQELQDSDDTESQSLLRMHRISLRIIKRACGVLIGKSNNDNLLRELNL